MYANWLPDASKIRAEFPAMVDKATPDSKQPCGVSINHITYVIIISDTLPRTKAACPALPDRASTTGEATGVGTKPDSHFNISAM